MSKRKQELPAEKDYLFSASSNDMTGLIPGNMPDEEELDNYEEVYPYQPPKKRGDL